MHISRSVLVASSFLSFFGCAGGGPSLEPTAGVVLLDGEPVSNATITLVPVAGSTSVATAITGDKGRFTMATAVSGRGAQFGVQAGEYRAGVVKIVSTAAAGNGQSGADIVASEPGQAPPPSQYLVPQGYADPQHSGLTATIAKGRNELKFELDSKFKPAK